MSKTQRQQALRAFRAAVAQENKLKDHAMAAADTDEAIGAWLQAIHATKRASHALRSAPAQPHAGDDKPDAHSS